MDWGEKRIGLAISDPTQTIAQPLTALHRRTGKRFPMKSFRELIEIHRPVGILVGLPLDVDGGEGPAAEAARGLAREIERATDVPLVLWDERLSTARAMRAVKEMGGGTRGRKGDVDQLAATVLLQSYLDRYGS